MSPKRDTVCRTRRFDPSIWPACERAPDIKLRHSTGSTILRRAFLPFNILFFVFLRADLCALRPSLTS